MLGRTYIQFYNLESSYGNQRNTFISTVEEAYKEMCDEKKCDESQKR